MSSFERLMAEGLQRADETPDLAVDYACQGVQFTRGVRDASNGHEPKHPGDPDYMDGYNSVNQV